VRRGEFLFWGVFCRLDTLADTPFESDLLREAFYIWRFTSGVLHLAFYS